MHCPGKNIRPYYILLILEMITIIQNEVIIINVDFSNYLHAQQ